MRHAIRQDLSVEPPDDIPIIHLMFKQTFANEAQDRLGVIARDQLLDFTSPSKRNKPLDEQF